MLLTPCFGAEHVRAPSLDEAMLEFRAGHTEQAAAQLRHLTAADPKNAAAWRALGNTYLKLKQAAAAIAALQTARELEPAAARTLYQLGVAYAVSGDLDAAVKWLREAKATERYDMTELSVDDRLVALRSDARFTELLPRAPDAAVLGERAGLRLDLLGGEDAAHRREQRVAVEQLEVAGQLLDAVDLAAALDLDGDVHAARRRGPGCRPGRSASGTRGAPAGSRRPACRCARPAAPAGAPRRRP